MGGIDKLVFDIPNAYSSYGENVGFTLEALIVTATRNGLLHRSCWFPNENKPGISFIDRTTNEPIAGCIIGYRGRRSGAIITKAQLNPSKFLSRHNLESFMSRINGPWFERAEASRLDAAADYPVPFNEFIRHVDVIGRSYSRIYMDQQVGVPRTLYFGAGVDKYVIYDKLFETGLNIYPPNFPSEWITRTRVERQLTNKQAIRNRIGHIITLDNLRYTLELLRTGEVCLFDAIIYLNIDYSWPIQISEEERQRRSMFEGMIRMSSFANARRYVNGAYNGNFIRDWERLLYVTPRPSSVQPNAVFQFELRHFGQRRALPSAALAG